MCDRINLPKTITDRANSLFKMVHDGRNLKGRANEAIASACLYIACRQEGVPRTFKEIVAVSTVSKKVISRIPITIILMDVNEIIIKSFLEEKFHSFEIFRKLADASNSS